MEATFLKEPGHCGKIAQNRKENHFKSQLTVIALVGGEMKEVIQARFYRPGVAAYCCVWIRGDLHISGGGKAGGGGYHKRSHALEDALDDAGVSLSEHIGGRGDEAMEEALLAVAGAMGHNEAKVFRAHG
jgi:hypothetical protein